MRDVPRLVRSFESGEHLREPLLTLEGGGVAPAAAAVVRGLLTIDVGERLGCRGAGTSDG